MEKQHGDEPLQKTPRPRVVTRYTETKHHNDGEATDARFSPTLLDELIAGNKSESDVANIIIANAYGPLKQYCSLPEAFATRTLGYEYHGIKTMKDEQIDALATHPPSMIIDPEKPHVEGIELLKKFLAGDSGVCRHKDPFQPTFGANFVGPPGCGKTHIMSAFAVMMKRFLDEKLEGYRKMVEEFVKKEYVQYIKKIERTRDPDNTKPIYFLSDKPEGGISEYAHPATVFAEKLETFTAALNRMQYRPPDLLYLEFDALCELCNGNETTRENVLQALNDAKILFIDDVHPKKDPERAQLISHIIEGRYAAGRPGTFITTNLTTDELATDNKVAERLRSRCEEMFYQIDFKGCTDWRTKVNARRIDLVRKPLQERVSKILEGFA